MAHVLLVDDIEELRDITRRSLEEIDLITKFDEASGGQEALDLFDPEEHDLVITDLQMPNIDGLGFLEAIAGYETPPRLMLSGVGSAKLYQQATSRGSAGLIVKPFPEGLLQNVVRELLTRRDGASPNLKAYSMAHGFVRSPQDEELFYEIIEESVEDLTGLTGRLTTDRLIRSPLGELIGYGANVLPHIERFLRGGNRFPDSAGKTAVTEQGLPLVLSRILPNIFPELEADRDREFYRRELCEYLDLKKD